MNNRVSWGEAVTAAEYCSREAGCNGCPFRAKEADCYTLLSDGIMEHVLERERNESKSDKWVELHPFSGISQSIKVANVARIYSSAAEYGTTVVFDDGVQERVRESYDEVRKLLGIVAECK